MRNGAKGPVFYKIGRENRTPKGRLGMGPCKYDKKKGPQKRPFSLVCQQPQPQLLLLPQSLPQPQPQPPQLPPRRMHRITRTMIHHQLLPKAMIPELQLQFI